MSTSVDQYHNCQRRQRFSWVVRNSMFQATSICCVAPFEDLYGGTGLRVPDACDSDILAVPLHNCLVVLDKYRSPNEYRGRVAVNYADVRLSYSGSLYGAVNKRIQPIEVAAACRSFPASRENGACDSRTQFPHMYGTSLCRKNSGLLRSLLGCDCTHMQGSVAHGGLSGYMHCPKRQTSLCCEEQVMRRSHA